LPVVEGNIRTKPELGGGTLYDIGVYCINAARYLFQDEPLEVVAASFAKEDPRFEGIDEATSAIMRFPGDRVASFVSSFGVADESTYEILGTKGTLRVDSAYNYVGAMTHALKIGEKTTERTFKTRDQFAPLLIELSRCIREDREPEPNGIEGLADVRIIEAIYTSAIERRPISIPPLEKPDRPDIGQEMKRPAVKKPSLVDVQSASGDD
jgi:predicted dehydrogenase